LASTGFRDILRVETIKDMHFGLMPPHEHQNHTLRDMDTLLQEMKHLNAPAFDHLEWTNPFSSLVKAGKATIGVGDIGKAQTKWKDSGDAGRNAILKSTLEKIVNDLPGWDNVHVVNLKDNMYKNDKVGPLWIAACTEYEKPTS